MRVRVEFDLLTARKTDLDGGRSNSNCRGETRSQTHWSATIAGKSGRGRRRAMDRLEGEQEKKQQRAADSDFEDCDDKTALCLFWVKGKSPLLRFALLRGFVHTNDADTTSNLPIVSSL